MQVQILQPTLSGALAIVGRAISNSAYQPIMRNVLIDAQPDRLTLSGYSDDLSIITEIRECKVLKPGMITTLHSLFGEWVNLMPPERVELCFDGLYLHASSEKHRARFKFIEPETFPVIETTVKDAASYTLPALDLAEIIEKTIFAALPNESRSVLACVQAEFKDGALITTAADGFRMSQIRLDEISASDHQALIPARLIGEVARLIKLLKPETVDVSLATEKAVFKIGDTTLVTKVMALKPLDLTQFIPAQRSLRAALDTKDFLKALKLSSILAREGANMIKLDVIPNGSLETGRVIVSAASAEFGDNVFELDASIEGDESMSIGFNVKYLKDALEVISTPQVWLDLISPAERGVLRPVEGNHTQVIMPMHISE